jgi:hypothetical protein
MFQQPLSLQQLHSLDERVLEALDNQPRRSLGLHQIVLVVLGVVAGAMTYQAHAWRSECLYWKELGVECLRQRNMLLDQTKRFVDENTRLLTENIQLKTEAALKKAGD